MSIRFRILIPMVIISVLASATILFSNVMQFSSYVDNYIEDELERAVLKVADEIERLEMKSRTTVLYYANDNKLIEAMDCGEREAVLKRAGELLAQTGVESLTIVDADAIVLARGHNPELYGDDTSNMPVVQLALEGKSVLGIERGISTSISARAASPVYNSHGRLLGAIFAGDRLDTDKFVDRLNSFTGCEISVFVDDVRVATTLYGEDGTRAIGYLSKGYAEKSLLAGDKITRQRNVQGHEIMTRHVPVLSGSGEISGIISVGRYLDEKQDMVTSFIATGVLITIIFILFSILIILFVSRRIAAPISNSINQAHYDELTGIFNRRSLEERFNSLVKTLSRSGGTLSLMMIDIDFFKNYNDTYGHVKGDDCLKAVADILTQTFSRADDLVARYGGEEFVAVLPNTDRNGACTMAKKLLESMRKCNILHEKSDVAGHVTISIGVTTGLVDRTLSSTDFIMQADSALYESKRKGRNTYTFMPMK